MSFKGNLKSFSLAEIFQSLSLNQHTGTLRICIDRDNPETARFVHFGKGTITFVSPASPKGYRIGEILTRRGLITTEQINTALELQQQRSDKKIGELLLEQGIVVEQDITDALTTQIEEELYDLFLLENAEFEFQINADPPFHKDPLQKTIQINIDPQPLIVEGVRRLDEWSIIRTKIQTFDEIFTPTGIEPDDLSKEESEVFHLLDGKTPVHLLFPRIAIGRFACSRTIFQLATSGLIREVSPAELAEYAANAEGEEEKLYYLKFSLQQEFENTKTRLELVRTCLSFDEHEQAVALMEEGLELNPPQEEQSELINEFINIAPNNTKALQAAVQLAIQEKRLEDAAKQTIDLTKILIHKGESGEAKKALKAIEGFMPDDPRYHLSIASLWKNCNEPLAGIPLLEFAAERYEKEENWGELNKTLRRIIEADPNRQDARYRMNQLAVALEKKGKVKRRKKILICAGICLLLVAAAIPLVYQSRANLAYAAVQAETLPLTNKNFSKARQLYANFKKSYSWSPLVKDAEQAMQRISQQEQLYQDRQKETLLAEQKRLDYLKKQPELILAQAQKEERSGDFEKAHMYLCTLKEKFPDSPQAKDLTFPLRLTSIPSGAEVLTQHKNKKKTKIGTTPLLIRYAEGQSITFFLNHKGCEPLTWKLPKTTPWEKHFKLKWTPLQQYKENIPVFGELKSLEHRLIFHSRNGKLYCFSPIEKNKGWSRQIGAYGDTTTRFAIYKNKIYGGIIDGDLMCIELTTGRMLWHTKLPGPAYLKPFVLDEATVFAATESGTVHILEKGMIKHTRKLIGRIPCGPLLIDGTLMAGTDTDFCIGLKQNDLQTLWRTSFPADITDGPFPCGKTAVVATRELKLYQLEPHTGKVINEATLPAALSAYPAAVDDTLYLPLENGVIVQFSEQKGMVNKTGISTTALSQPFFYQQKLFLGDLYGRLYAFDPFSGMVKWSYATSGPVVSQPCLFGGKILFSTKSGTFFVMEPLP